MSRNPSGAIIGEVGSKLTPLVLASGPLMGFFGLVCVVGMICMAISGGYSALFSTAAVLDAYLERGVGFMLVLIVMPSLVLTPLIGRMTRNHWQAAYRRPKILAGLLAFTVVYLTVVSTINGSHIWSQLAYHYGTADRSALMAWSCPSEAVKAAPNTRSSYDVDKCEKYLPRKAVDDLCWQVYRTMQPIVGSTCMWRRRELTGTDWPVEGGHTQAFWDRSSKTPVFFPAPASKDEMRAILVRKGLTPLS